MAKFYEIIEEHYEDGEWKWSEGTALYYASRKNAKKACKMASALTRDSLIKYSYEKIETQDEK
jgi:hypothetical protein